MGLSSMATNSFRVEKKPDDGSFEIFHGERRLAHVGEGFFRLYVNGFPTAIAEEVSSILRLLDQGRTEEAQGAFQSLSETLNRLSALLRITRRNEAAAQNQANTGVFTVEEPVQAKSE